MREMKVLCVPYTASVSLVHSSKIRTAVIWLKYCRYGVKPYVSISQSNNQSRIKEITSQLFVDCEKRENVRGSLIDTKWYSSSSSCDNVAVSVFFKFDFFISNLQWRSSRSDSLPLCFGHFPTSYMNIYFMKNSLKKLKLFGAIKLRKLTLCML